MDGSCENCLRLAHCYYVVKQDVCINASEAGNDKFKKSKIVKSDLNCPPKLADLPRDSGSGATPAGDTNNTTTTEAPTTTRSVAMKSLSVS